MSFLSNLYPQMAGGTGQSSPQGGAQQPVARRDPLAMWRGSGQNTLTNHLQSLQNTVNAGGQPARYASSQLNQLKQQYAPLATGPTGQVLAGDRYRGMAKNFQEGNNFFYPQQQAMAQVQPEQQSAPGSMYQAPITADNAGDYARGPSTTPLSTLLLGNQGYQANSYDQYGNPVYEEYDPWSWYSK